MTDVFATEGRYRAALEELPLSTRRVEVPNGAIVVVPGTTGWVDRALAAQTAGAIAVIVTRPEFVSAADVRRVTDSVSVPIIVERPLLRPDVASDAVAGRFRALDPAVPRILLADAAASEAWLAPVTRDAIGWLRVLAGDELSVVAVDAGLALLETRQGIIASLTVVSTARPGAGLIRAQALGEVITQVEVEGGVARVDTMSAEGRLIAPTRFESTERLALRRAVQFSGGGPAPDDIGELFADTALVEQILPFPR